MNKKQTVDRHFAIRCLQRIGHIPDDKELVLKIQQGNLNFYDRQSNRLTRWEWTDHITQKPCLLVYDKTRKQLVTILLVDEMEKYSYRG